MTTRDIELSFQEIWKLFHETDRQIKATDRQLQRTDQELRDLFAKTDAKIDALTGKWGRFVEGLVVPAAERLFRERGIAVERISQRVKAHKNGDRLEIDILAVNGDYAVLIEVKSTLGVDDVNEHLERLNKFKLFFPEYAGRRVLGAVAGIVIDENADKYAYRKGLFVIGQKGDTVRILNDERFEPTVW